MKATSNLTLLSSKNLNMIAMGEQALRRAMKETLLQNNYTLFSYAIEQQLTAGEMETIEAIFSLFAEKISHPPLKAAAEFGFFKRYHASHFFFLSQYARLIHLKEIADFLTQITEKETFNHSSLNYLTFPEAKANLTHQTYLMN